MIYEKILSGKSRNKKILAVLIDPDKLGSNQELSVFIHNCAAANVDFILVGGSLLLSNNFDTIVKGIKSLTKIPIILFPGNCTQISKYADGILLLSLISGRNAELLIGQHVSAAPSIKAAKIEVISTGYVLIDCGSPTTVSYISQTHPIPYNKPEIAGVTALAGEQLGMKIIYLDGGSGAQKPISEKTIQTVKNWVDLPIIVGGGIKNIAEAENAWNAGATVVVIGTAFEKNTDIMLDFANRSTIKSN